VVHWQRSARRRFSLNVALVDTEDLCRDFRLVNRHAVDADEGTAGAPALPVNCPSHRPLSHARLDANQDGSAGRADPPA
jgi:hypothetical protein